MLLSFTKTPENIKYKFPKARLIHKLYNQDIFKEREIHILIMTQTTQKKTTKEQRSKNNSSKIQSTKMVISEYKSHQV